MDNIDSLSNSYLVELSVVAPQGQDKVQDDIKNFAEHLKPYPTFTNLLLYTGILIVEMYMWELIFTFLKHILICRNLNLFPKLHLNISTYSIQLIIKIAT